MDRLQKCRQFGPTGLDNRMSENVQNIRRRHKLHHGRHEKHENRINCRRENPSGEENSETHFHGRCALATTICNRIDATQLHS